MPIPSPFHERTFPLCETYRFKDWAGRIAVCSYDVNVEREYFALRQSAGLIDVSPLYKYELSGPDAAAVLSRMLVRDVRRLRVGRVAYSCWCDDQGMVIDDGTVTRLKKQRFRLTAAEPALDWLHKIVAGSDVELVDRSDELAVLAVQGPSSRDLISQALGESLGHLKYFAAQPFSLQPQSNSQPIEGWVTRTGYTGDLGYEVWVDETQALPLWDLLMKVGARYSLQPVGLDALDISRIEAGYLLHGIDYHGAHEEPRIKQRSTPFELSWDWMTHLDRDEFVGRTALLKARRSPRLQLVGLELDFAAMTELYAEYDLPPHLPGSASREALPVYTDSGKQVGQLTSHTWSPLLKKPIGLASVEPSYAEKGNQFLVEHTVDYDRRKIRAAVTELPFYDPPWKRQ